MLFDKIINMRFLLFLLISFVFSQSYSREILNMNTDWAFYRGDKIDGASPNIDVSDWIPIVVPHIMQLEKKHCGGNSIYDGIGWYRRNFKVPSKYIGKRIVLSFEGVMTNCDVYVNGKNVSQHNGGYMGFVVDITDIVEYNTNNVLSVRVSAEYDPLTPPGKPQDKMDFYYYSGIYRDVKMIVTDKLFISDPLEENIVAGGGQFVRFKDVTKNKATVSIDTHIRNKRENNCNLEVKSIIVDNKNKIVGSVINNISISKNSDCKVSQLIELIKPHLWHPYNPYLYTLKTYLIQEGTTVDLVETKIGVRNIEFSIDKGFQINGESLYLRGANRHQAFANIGDAAPNSMQERDVLLLKKGGYNAVRAAHYPQDPAFLDACDKYGLLVVECIPGWQYFNSDSLFINRLFDVGRKMIRRDRNRPSVILWETALNESRYPVSLAKEIHKLAHDEYPGSQMYTSGDYFGHVDMFDYYDVFYKQVSKFPKDGNVMSNYPEDFITVKPLLTREWGDGVGEKPRVSLIESEEALMKQCRGRFEQLNGNGYFDWCMLDANPHMAGHFLWSFNDYARGSQDQTMFCGVVDINRYPKFSYYMMQSMRDPSISQKGIYDGPMVYIASYNSSEKYVSSTTEITVFSNCDEVKLYRNGKLIGLQNREEQSRLYKPIVDKGGSPCFVFNAGGYEAGTLKAEAYINGKLVAEHSVSTPEAPNSIDIDFKTEGISPIANGYDLIPVYFYIKDSNGNIVNTSNHRISIDVSGEGSLVGDKIERLGINPQVVEGGVGFVFVRTTKKAGKINIKVTADGLNGCEKTISTKASDEEFVPIGTVVDYNGNEEDNVVVKESSWQQKILLKERLKLTDVVVSSYQKEYPKSNVIDNDDSTWWIADSDTVPQIITVSLSNIEYVQASRILFQKDSSSYKHRAETSKDGEKWELLYDRECTGWEFKPQTVDREIKYFRVVIYGVSEGRAGVGEISLY